MNLDHPHDLVFRRDPPPIKPQRYLPLTPDEAAKIKFLSVEQRAAWLASIGDEKIRERMDRWTKDGVRP